MSERQKDKDGHFAKTLARGVELLQAFGRDTEVMGNGELAAVTALDRATVARLTYTLVQTGFLEHDSRLRKYRLAPGVLKFGYPLLASMHVRQLARPYMQDLATRIKGTVGLGLRHYVNMVYVDAVVDYDGPNPALDRGMAVPLLASAMGNAWLAFADPTEREQALNMHRIARPGFHSTYAGRSATAIREFREKGYCTSIGYRLRDRFSVATPLRQRLNGQIVVFNCTVAMGVSGESVADLRNHLGPQLLEMVRQIEKVAGMSPD